ncbi:unnamed protein product [Porites evermanni]|uniref:Uncharacterized protein n=1 Tax=Porites evermanni TaxID=104178 RepID=A0ABN8PG07_9CNID|nr:unnamed protein product [Porites evermanni]
MTARNSMGEEIDAMFTTDHKDNSNGIIDSVQEEGRVQFLGDTTKISSLSRLSAGQVCVDKSKQRFHTSVLPSPTPVDMPTKRTVEPSKPKARKIRSYNIERNSTCIGQENASHGERYN